MKPLSASEERQAAFRSCERFLNAHGPRRPREELAALSAVAGDVAPDVYGSGGVLEELEGEVAQLLGKPAAVFMPSGTMAQPIALRIHADDTRCRLLGFHPTCHLELHEQRGYSQLHGLDARLVGRRDRLIELADLEALSGPLAALLIELPQREIGGLLPSWEALGEQAEWARRRGVRLHLDGARLWECAPFYQKTYQEICAPFDSVYVSFYKALGAIAGAVLAGSVELVQRARVWQRRQGGNLVSLYPYALSARESLHLRLGRMAQYRDGAQRIARVLRALPGVRITPDPPQTNLLHAYLPVDGERLLEASADLARREKVALFTRTRACDVPGYTCVEVSIGDGAAALGDAELGELLRSVLASAG
jgi:threonine aldolase